MTYWIPAFAGMTVSEGSQFQATDLDLRTPPDHQMRHAPSSETMHGPTGVRGVQALP